MNSPLNFTIPLSLILLIVLIVMVTTYLNHDKRVMKLLLLISFILSFLGGVVLYQSGLYVDENGLSGDVKDFYIGIFILIIFIITFVFSIKDRPNQSQKN